MLRTILSICLAIFTFSTVLNQEVLASNEKELDVYETGLYQSAESTSENISEELVEITTVEGERVEGDFKVTEHFFKAEFQFEDEAYILNGERVANKGMKYFEFEGNVADKENQTFQAYVEKDRYKYRITLNILTHVENNPLEIEDAQTFIFDGNDKPSISKENRKVDYTTRHFNPNASEDKISIMNAYYERQALHYGTYMNSLVQGPSRMDNGQSDYHSVRSTTKSSTVNSYWNNQSAYSNARETKVLNYSVSISTSKAAAFTPIDPLTSSKTSFNVPVWLGSTLGIQNIPVAVSSTSISGAATGNLRFAFSWASTSGYLDNTSITSTKPTKGYGVRYEFDTASTIGTGSASIICTPKMKYQTKVTSGYNWYWVYKEASNNANYAIDIY